jgi:hypothetical protein
MTTNSEQRTSDPHGFAAEGKEPAEDWIDEAAELLTLCRYDSAHPHHASTKESYKRIISEAYAAQRAQGGSAEELAREVADKFRAIVDHDYMLTYIRDEIITKVPTRRIHEIRDRLQNTGAACPYAPTSPKQLKLVDAFWCGAEQVKSTMLSVFDELMTKDAASREQAPKLDTLLPLARAAWDEQKKHIKELDDAWIVDFAATFAINQWSNDRKQDPQSEDMRLLNLLAVIHRDGGHYVATNGLDKACTDAETMVLAERGELYKRREQATATPIVDTVSKQPQP